MKCLASGMTSTCEPRTCAASARDIPGSAPGVSAPMIISVGTPDRLGICAGKRLAPLVGLAEQCARVVAPGLPHRRRHPLPGARTIVVLSEKRQRTVDVAAGDALRRHVVAGTDSMHRRRRVGWQQ